MPVKTSVAANTTVRTNEENDHAGPLKCLDFEKPVQ